MSSLEDRFRKKSRFLQSIGTNDSRTRLSGFLEWMESQPEIKTVLTNIRDTDVSSLLEDCSPRRGPAPSTEEEVAAIGLHLLESCRNGAELYDLAISLGIGSSFDANQLQDYIASAIQSYIEPLLEYIADSLEGMEPDDSGRFGAATHAPEPEPEGLGLAFPGWTLVEELAGGGQGYTYKVRSQGGTNAVAVLKYPKQRAHAKERFVREASRLRQLDHPCVVRFIEASLDHDPPFLVTEYCGDGELSAEAIRYLPIRQRLEVFCRICDGVAAAHSAGVVHRDLKPSNILFRRFPHDVVVADFGISFSHDDSDRLTETNEPVGARCFTAPELDGMRADPDSITPAADVYSLGKLLYYLLSGRVFIREDYDTAENDLVAREPSTSIYRFVNELLGRTVVRERSGRLQDASHLLKESSRLLELLDMDTPFITINELPKCSYCKVGQYFVSHKLSPAQAANEHVKPQVPLNPNGGYIQLQCQHCGHRHEFFPSRKAWKDTWSLDA